MIAARGDERLARAADYPYPAPARSYLFVNGAPYEIVEMAGDPTRDALLRTPAGARPATAVLHDLGVRRAPGLDERVAVIAHGSNASPEQLARKFAHVEDDVVIPVIKARLADHDVVYAPHFTRYGAIPATLAPAPGTVAEVAVTFLSPPELVRMNHSETAAANYVYGLLGGVSLALDRLPALAEAHVYLTRHGALALDGGPFALAARPALGRRLASLTTPAMLARARDRVAPGRRLAAFVVETVADAALRARRTAMLREHARAVALPAFEAIAE